MLQFGAQTRKHCDPDRLPVPVGTGWVLIELLSLLCYQTQTVTRFVYRQRHGFVVALIVALVLCGLVYTELKVLELNAIDNDDISADTANAADLLSLAAPTVLLHDVAKDIALLTSHRGLSRARVKAQRLQTIVTPTESCRKGGRPIGSLSHCTASERLHRLCIQRI
jgi:hypothetical protein